MNVEPSAEMRAFVEHLVGTEEYTTPSDVAEAALRHFRIAYETHWESIRQAIESAEAEVKAGSVEFVPALNIDAASTPVVLSHTAAEQLRALPGELGEPLAGRLSREVTRLCGKLATEPGLGQRHPKLRHPGQRLLPAGPYLLIYAPGVERIVVLAFTRGSSGAAGLAF